MSDDVQDNDRKHFNMLRSFVLADVITLGNASCGTASVFMCLQFIDEQDPTYLWVAFALLPISMILDFLDGFVARWRKKSSQMGADLDSLSDIVSFGVAPAVIAYTLGMRGGWDTAILIYFVACGISRLARYNVTAGELSGDDGKVRYYEGTPIPTSLALVIVLAIAFGTGHVQDALWLGEVKFATMTWHPLSLMYAVSGSLMISETFRIPKP